MYLFSKDTNSSEKVPFIFMGAVYRKSMAVLLLLVAQDIG